MENNNLIINQIPTLSEAERKQALMIMEIRNFMGLTEPQPDQMLQLQEMDYDRQVRKHDNLDYLLAISG